MARDTLKQKILKRIRDLKKMNYRIIIPRGFNVGYPYRIQCRATWWYIFWKDMSGPDTESIDEAKRQIIDHIRDEKLRKEWADKQPKPGVILVYTSEDQVVDKLRGSI